MKANTIIVCIVLALGMLTPGAANSQTLDELSSCVVFLRQETVKTAEFEGAHYELWLKLPNTNVFRPFPDVQTGSGILVATTGSPIHAYLVTAAHVAKPMSPSGWAVFRGPSDVPIVIPLATLAGQPTNLSWVIHDTADLAVLPVDLLVPKVAALLQGHALPITCFSPGHAAPDRADTLTTLGFPLALGVSDKFSPISKSSSPASGLITLPRADTKTPATMFLLQDPSIGGFSGAPVFDLPGIRLSGSAMVAHQGVACFGITHGTLSDDTGGKLAAVTPSSAVIELIDKAEKECWKNGVGQPVAAPNAAPPRR